MFSTAHVDGNGITLHVHCFVTRCFSYTSVVYSEQTMLNLSHTVTEVWLTSRRGQKLIIVSRRTAV